MSTWWNKKKEIPYNKSFYDILEFYLFSCPCERKNGSGKDKRYIKISNRSKTLREQGWTGGYLNTLIASMKHTTSGNLVYRPLDARASVEAETNNVEKSLSLSDEHFEMIVFCKRTDMNLTSSIFYYIRNAFAHGSFSVVAGTYYFESQKNGKVKARIRLREKTLLEWMKCFKVSPAKLKSELQSQTKNSRKRRKAA